MKKTLKILLASAITSAIFIMPILSEDAKTIYETKCAACHGKSGKGDTKMGKKLEIKDFTDPKVQAAMKDEDMIKAIKEGIKEGETTKMKGFGDKLSDDEIRAIVAYLRKFKSS